MANDARKHAPSVARNREPITRVLKEHLPKQGVLLEIASGSGEHIVHFAQEFGPGLTFQPSDPDPEARASINEWVATLGLDNILPAIALDAMARNWPDIGADVVVCINMIHIAPWDAAIGLMRGAAAVLRPGRTLFLYGPYRQGGQHTSPGNHAFDEDLRSRNPEWGVRDLEAVASLAQQHGFSAPVIVPMPANNLSLVFTRLK